MLSDKAQNNVAIGRVLARKHKKYCGKWETFLRILPEITEYFSIFLINIKYIEISVADNRHSCSSCRARIDIVSLDYSAGLCVNQLTGNYNVPACSSAYVCLPAII